MSDLAPDKTVLCEQILSNCEDGEPTALNTDHIERKAFVCAALALGGPGMVAKYPAEQIANQLIAHDIESVAFLEIILMDEGSARQLWDKLFSPLFPPHFPPLLIALTKAHLRAAPPENDRDETAVMKSAQALLCEWGFSEQVTLDNVPRNTPLFDLSQQCIMLPAYMAIVIKSLRNLHEQSQTVDVGFTLILRINFGGTPPELAREITDGLQFRINELPAVFDSETTDAKWQKNLYVVTSRMVRLACVHSRRRSRFRSRLRRRRRLSPTRRRP